MKFKLLLRAGLAALSCSVALLAHAGDWSHSQKITLDTTAEGANLTQEAAQVPIAVRLHSGNFAFADAKPDGADLRFMSTDGKTPLKFHIEQFDTANELAVAWVQVPQVPANASNAGFVMQWGNPEAASSADARATYDNRQLFVLHFSDKEGVRDATGNANHAREATGQPVSAGPMGSAMAFDGTQRVVLPAAPSLQIGATGGFTFTAWLKPAAAEDGKLLVIGSGGQALTIGLAAGVPTVAQGAAQVKASTPLKPGAWQHLAVTADGSKLNFFIDGIEAGSADLALADASGDAVLGEGYRGELDEATLAGAARSAGYVKALAVSQSADSFLLTFDEEGEGGESASYFSILLGAVTVDGWVVIGILVVMFVISVVVMVSKAQFLTRTRKGNEEFLDRFRNAAADMLTPGKPAARPQGDDPVVRHSCISRLYTIGLEEISHRFEAMRKAGVPVSLSAAALDSIRASLDAALVRENQRLNNQIVLLTIAISGGPFLGLLGTVVGVMITFAAIAAAGDVNVNSIAPGIAAALVATVAGLGVAIPALFGYNWLASQIKNVSADMQVFADEFVTKAAELHSV